MMSYGGLKTSLFSKIMGLKLKFSWFSIRDFLDILYLKDACVAIQIFTKHQVRIWKKKSQVIDLCD